MIRRVGRRALREVFEWPRLVMSWDEAKLYMPYDVLRAWPPVLPREPEKLDWHTGCARVADLPSTVPWKREKARKYGREMVGIDIRRVPPVILEEEWLWDNEAWEDYPRLVVADGEHRIYGANSADIPLLPVLVGRPRDREPILEILDCPVLV